MEQSLRWMKYYIAAKKRRNILNVSGAHASIFVVVIASTPSEYIFLMHALIHYILYTVFSLRFFESIRMSSEFVTFSAEKGYKINACMVMKTHDHDIEIEINTHNEWYHMKIN